MKRYCLSAIVFILFSTVSFAVEVSDWITVEGEALAENRTVEEAEELAMARAKRRAVEQFCHLKVVAGTYVRNYQMELDFVDAVSFGEVVESEIIEKTTTDIRKNPSDPLLIMVHVKMRVKVARSEGEPDPFFQVSAKLGKTLFKHGESSRLKIMATKDCYITILNITADSKIYQLFPNKRIPSFQLKANTEWVFPQELTAVCLEGSRKNVEVLKIIATKEPLPSLDFEDAIFEEYSGMVIWSRLEHGFEDLAKMIVNIPQNQRVETNVIYEVMRD